MKNVPMSPQKVREVARQIQGLPAERAQAVLAVVPRKSARLMAKTLKSARANAEDLKQNNKDYRELKIESLYIKEAAAQTGIRYRRFTPKARGSAGPIIKRRSHIKIILADE